MRVSMLKTLNFMKFLSIFWVNLLKLISLGRQLRWQLRNEVVRIVFTHNLVLHRFKPTRIPSISRQGEFGNDCWMKKPLRAKRLNPNSRLPCIKRFSDKMETESNFSETVSNKENETENKSDRTHIRNKIRRWGYNLYF